MERSSYFLAYDAETGNYLYFIKAERERGMERSKQFKLKNIQSRKRNTILKRDNYTCRLCGYEGKEIPLHAHHLTPLSLGGDNSMNNLITTCESCHWFIHANPKTIISQRKKHSKRTKEGWCKYNCRTS